MFSNPVAQAIIRPHGSPVILGDFRVTAPFGAIDADHPTPHGGCDIGNGKCGEPLLAMSDATITLAGKVPGSDALIIRGVDPAYPDYEWAVAHCGTVNVLKGQKVHRGDRIGTLGKTGTKACHCHIGAKYKGVSVDPWPLLNQNRQEENMLQGTFVAVVSNRRGLVKADNTRLRSSPFVKADNILAELPANRAFDPDYIVKGTLVGADPNWYGGWASTAKGLEFGYLYVAGLTPLKPIESTGHTDAELEAARTAGRASGIQAARDDLADLK